MSATQFRNWHAIKAEVLRRIHAQEWPPGHTIPNEVDLAVEFGCARATVNRALQALADAGFLERRRKAGTRVALHPTGKAIVDIPVIRREIESRGSGYGYQLLSRDLTAPPEHLDGNAKALHVTALHSADARPYVYEDRWIDIATLPAAMDEPFDRISANEWLVKTAPYTHGTITFAAETADEARAAQLQTQPGAALFVVARTTWNRERIITNVRLTYAPGYVIETSIGTGGIAV